MTRGQIGAVAAIWAVTLLLAVLSVLDAPHAALLAACATAAAVLRPDQPSGVANLPPLPPPQHAGAHGDLADLAWRMYDVDGSVSDRPMVRVRALTHDLPGLQAEIDSCRHPTSAQVLQWLDTIKKAQEAS